MRNKLVSLGFILLVIFSFIITFYSFPTAPKFLAFDEVEFTKLALSLDNKPYLAYSNLATGHSTLYFYILLISLKIFGTNVFALRLPSAIFGILSVIMFYLISKNVIKKIDNVFFAKYLPFFLTLIFLTSRWFIDFTRFAFEPTFLLFLELTSIYFLIQSFKNLKWQYLIFSGIFAGLSYNSYTPGRFFFVVPLIFLTLQTLRTFKLYKLLYFIIPLVIIAAPLTVSLSRIKESRVDQLFFWKNHEMTVQQKISGTLQNLSNISLMFFVKGDMNGKHNYPGKPALNPILAGLFLIGVLAAFKNYKNKYNQLFITYFAVSILPSIPIYPWENPSMLRTFTAIPSVVYFIGLGIILIGKKISPKYLIFVIALIFISSFYELRTYFKYQIPVFEQAFEIRHPLDKAIKMKNPYERIK